MEVIRFMSEAEKELYLSGAKMFNATDHKKYNNSTSVGFCFAELTEARNPDKWNKKLAGITNCEWCVVFDMDDFKKPLNESSAVYSHDERMFEKMEVREWCTTEYSLNTHPYKRIGKCPDLFTLVCGGKIEWQ